jgi:hypothetical protein
MQALKVYCTFSTYLLVNSLKTVEAGNGTHKYAHEVPTTCIVDHQPLSPSHKAIRPQHHPFSLPPIYATVNVAFDLKSALLAPA